MPVNILLSLSATLYRPDDSRRRSAHTSQMNEFRPNFHKIQISEQHRICSSFL